MPVPKFPRTADREPSAPIPLLRAKSSADTDIDQAEPKSRRVIQSNESSRARADP